MLLIHRRSDDKGTNDSSNAEVNSKHVPIPLFRQNIDTILERLTSPSSPYAVAHSSVPVSIILITPPGVEASLLDDPNHITSERTQTYSDAVLDIGKEWARKNKEGDNWKIGTIDLAGAILKAGEQGGTRQFYKFVVGYCEAERRADR
jgi:hypothetical protein